VLDPPLSLLFGPFAFPAFSQTALFGNGLRSSPDFRFSSCPGFDQLFPSDIVLISVGSTIAASILLRPRFWLPFPRVLITLFAGLGNLRPSFCLSFEGPSQQLCHDAIFGQRRRSSSPLSLFTSPPSRQKIPLFQAFYFVLPNGTAATLRISNAFFWSVRRHFKLFSDLRSS